MTTEDKRIVSIEGKDIGLTNKGEKLKVAVINISLRPGANVRYFPVGLGFIMTAIRDAGYDFDYIDQDLYNLSQDEVVDLLGLRGDMTLFSWAVSLRDFVLLKVR